MPRLSVLAGWLFACIVVMTCCTAFFSRSNRSVAPFLRAIAHRSLPRPAGFELSQWQAKAQGGPP